MAVAKSESLTSSGFDPEQPFGQIADLKMKRWGKRHTLVAFSFLGLIIANVLRVNIYFSIVSMVGTNSHENFASNIHNITVACPNLDTKLSLDVNKENPESIRKGEKREFDWNGQDQSEILAALGAGNALSLIAGGILTDKYGGKWPLGFAILASSFLALLTPMAARTGKIALIAVRFLQGLAEGFSCVDGLIAKWIPKLERSTLGVIIHSGSKIGIILTTIMSSVLINSEFWGWEGTYYIPGMFGILWFIFFTIFVFNNPNSHPTICAKEKSFIHDSIGLETTQHYEFTPWSKLLTSMPVMAIFVAQIGQNVGDSVLLVLLPTYIHRVLNLDIVSNTWLVSLPYMLLGITSCIVGRTADYLRKKNIASTSSVRKVCNTFGHWGPAFALVGVAISGCDAVYAVMCLNIAITLNGFTSAGHQINHIDLAPNHAAVLSGVGKTIARICEVIQLYIFGSITKNGGSINDWRLVFLIAVAVYFVDNLFYIIFASGEEQHWNRLRKVNCTVRSEPSESDPLLPKNHIPYSGL